MKKYLLLLPALLLAACASNRVPPVQTVASLDLERYQGIWHEIARLPNRFEDGRGLDCQDVTATYTPGPHGGIRVLNQCRNAADGNALKQAHGRARVVPGSNNTKLLVTFFWPFRGDYWVVGLAPDYSWAVVGDPDRDYLWVLARTPAMRPADWEAALASAAAQGFDTSKLKRTVQTAASSVAR